MAKQIRHTATDKTMTLSELAAFVQDALNSGADGTERLKSNVAFSGRVKDLTVEVAAPPQDSLGAKAPDWA
ncbi:hypothetical protein [Streptomyces lushanensis]|uniref:hypothetical protein n=1 Tax=Streptomyces lushanensis TaxID=1434255 RepID=UPI00114CC5C7|nr:hypothetical protein [Streptomyces lushanensis]